MLRYEDKFEKLKSGLRVYHDGPLTIYYFAYRLYWNRYGKLQRVDDDLVNSYFDIN